MASSSGRPSTPEGPSSRRSSSEAGDTLVLGLGRASDVTALDIIGKVDAGDVFGLQKLEKKLKKKGSSVLEEMAAAKDPEKVEAESLLHMAAEWGQLEMCKYLIKDLGLPVDAPREDGGTPLMSAINGTKCPKTVGLLLRRGADPNKANKIGFTALHFAIKGTRKIAELLLTNGADVDAICEEGTALHIAIKDGKEDAVEMLLARGANTNIANRNEFTPLHVATIQGNCKIAKLLLSKNANVDAICKRGTPLHIAVEHGNLEMLRFLVEKADADKSNGDGTMPIELAAIQGWREGVEILFGYTTPIDKYADWSIAGIIGHWKSLMEGASMKKGC